MTECCLLVKVTYDTILFRMYNNFGINGTRILTEKVFLPSALTNLEHSKIDFFKSFFKMFLKLGFFSNIIPISIGRRLVCLLCVCSPSMRKFKKSNLSTVHHPYLPTFNRFTVWCNIWYTHLMLILGADCYSAPVLIKWVTFCIMSNLYGQWGASWIKNL